MSTSTIPTEASTSNSDMPLREDILVTIIICSVIGAILLMLLAVLVILLVIVYWNKDRHRIREYSFGTPTCKKLSPRHRSYKEAVELNKQPAELLTIASQVPPLPQQDSDMLVHTLTFSSLLKASTCGQSSNKSDPVTSVSRTSLEEVKDRGHAMEEDNVFIENNTKAGLHLVTTINSSTFEKQHSSCVSTFASLGYRNDDFRKDLTHFQGNLHTHSLKGNVHTDNQNESDSSLHVNTPTSTTNQDYVNVPRHASVALSLLSEHKNYHDSSYVNCSHHTSISSRASHACQTKDTRALPPRTHQTEIVVECATCTQTGGPCKNKCVHQENGYVNIIPGHRLVSQPTADSSTAAACTRHSAYTEQDYVNVSKQSIIISSSSQPNLTSADIMNSSLIPPRTILRRSCDNCKVSNETPPLPPRLTTPHIHKPLQHFTHKVLAPNTCGFLPVQVVHSTRCKPTEIKSNSHSEYLSNDIAREDEGTTLLLATDADNTDDNSSLINLLNSYSSEGTSVDEVSSECGDLQENKHNNFSVDEEFSESVESLDMWPPVIPRHTELKYIVANHDSKDLHSSENINMTTNQSYVNFK